MMYAYMTLSDQTEIVHSHLLNENGQKKVEVHFERPTEAGFDSSRCVLPDYRWMHNEGFTQEELRFFEEFLINNAHLIFRYAETGGVHIV